MVTSARGFFDKCSQPGTNLSYHRTKVQPERSSISVQAYPYTALTSHEHIRVVHLLAGIPQSRLIARLQEVPLGVQHLGYEALSYVWGDETDPATITILDSGTREFALKITRNLEEALQNLRDTKKSRMIWIDAVCINQDDLVERAHQVQLMTRVYKEASRVIVWLGPESYDSEIAMAWLKEVGKHVTYIEATNRVVQPESSDVAHWSQESGTVEQTHEELWAVINLFSRAWFRRLWIWQEVHMGGPASLLRCGQSSITWPSFRAVVHVLTRSGKTFREDSNDCGYLTQALTSVASICDKQSDYQLFQMQAMRASECKQPSDRVYTAYALAADPEYSIELKPDYSMPYQIVYLEWAIKYVEQRKNLEVLEYVAPLDRSSGLPSWVPDWSRRRERELHRIVGDASAGAQPSVIRIDQEQLRLHGILVTRVAHIIPADIEPSKLTPNGFRRFLSQMAHDLFSIETVPWNLERFCRVLAGNNVADACVQSWFMTDVSISRLVDIMKDILDSGGQPLSMKATRDVSSMCRVLHGRSIIVGDNGGLGVAAHCQEGDHIVVMLGCSTPCVLRPLGDGTYHILSEASFENCMAGEMLHGPLPEAYQYLWQVTTPGILDRVFKNMEDGTLTYDDPRLPPPPSAWEWVSDIELPRTRYDLYWKNRETGEERSNDPRCDFDYLKARGVKLEAFTLV